MTYSMKKYTLLLAIGICSHIGFSQTDFISVQDGDWEDGATWGNTSPGIEGTDFPGASDDAYTNGFSIDITGTVDVNNLFVQFDVDNGINFNSSSRTCQIHGTLVGWDGDDGGNEEIPDTDVVDTDEEGRFRFIGDGTFFDGSDNIIFSWSTDATLFRVLVDLNSSSTTVEMEDADIQIASGGYFRVDDGILDVGSGNSITGTSSDSVLRILGGGTLDMSINVSGFSELDIDASGSIITTGYINSTTCTIDGSLTTSFIGASQTQGWWQTTNSPSTMSIGTGSTISFSASANQSIPSETYGNLTLSGSGTKDLVTQVAGTLVVVGDFIINSASVTFTTGITSESQFQGDVTNNGTWTTSAIQDIRFNGSTVQTVGGSNAITFNDNVVFANASGVDFDVDVVFASTISDNNNPIIFSQDFTFNGTTYNQGSGVITFDGASQQIAGSGDINFEDITLSNSTMAINATNASLSGLLSMTTSIFDADGSGAGSFTLISNSSGTASVGDLTGSTVSGNWIVQRFFDGTGDVWRNFGVGVSGATVTNITGSGFTINGNDLAHYDETEVVLGTIDDGWVTQSTFGSNLSNSRGYSMWTRDTEVTNTVEFTGTLNTGNQNMTVSRTAGPVSAAADGWSLVNNPYASTIDWDFVFATSSNIDAFASVWDGTQYLTVGSGGDIPSGFIASGQAFWVHSTSGTPTLTIQETDKVSNSTAFLRTGEETYKDRLIVKLSDGINSDNTYIWFRSGSTPDFDASYDALKLANGIFNLSSMAFSGEELAVNSMGEITDCSESIKLNITNISEGNYNLNFEDLLSFTSGFDITLVDNFLNTSEVLIEGSSYDFDVTADMASYGNSRFELEFTAVELETNLSTSVVNNCDQESISIFIDNTQIGVDYSLMSGANVVASDTGNGSQLELHILKSTLTEGANTYEVSIDNGTCGNATANNTVSYEFVELIEVASVTDGSSCGKGSIIISADGAPADGYYRWYESFDSSEPILGENAANFTTPELQESKVYFVSIVNTEGCESIERKPVSVIINELPQTPQIVMEGNILVSSAKENNQWYIDGLLIEGASDNIFEVVESGSYSVSVENSAGCRSDSESVVMTITAVFGDNFDDNVLSIFPNPVGNEQLTISANQLSAYKTIQLYNSKGLLMLTKQIEIKNTVQIDMSGFSKGIYFIHLKGESGSAVHKLLKN